MYISSDSGINLRIMQVNLYFWYTFYNIFLHLKKTILISRDAHDRVPGTINSAVHVHIQYKTSMSSINAKTICVCNGFAHLNNLSTLQITIYNSIDNLNSSHELKITRVSRALSVYKFHLIIRNL